MMVEYSFAEVVEEVKEDAAYAVDGAVRISIFFFKFYFSYQCFNR